MSDWWWSYLLTAVGITGFLLAGRKVWWAWHVNIGCQALWMAYALVTQQWGFIIAAVMYTAVFTKNAITWTRDRPRRLHPHARGYLWRHYGPRCGAVSPRQVRGATCVRWRGHEPADRGWHADGTGYVWDETRWRWMGLPAPVEGTISPQPGSAHD